jgi:phosphoribosylaminoimidazole (AIR) synthetase
MVAIVPRDATADVLQRLEAMDEKAYLIGEIVEGKNSNDRITWE